jgi:hypothetical protein
LGEESPALKASPPGSCLIEPTPAYVALGRSLYLSGPQSLGRSEKEGAKKREKERGKKSPDTGCYLAAKEDFNRKNKKEKKKKKQRKEKGQREQTEQAGQREEGRLWGQGETRGTQPPLGRQGARIGVGRR